MSAAGSFDPVDVAAVWRHPPDRMPPRERSERINLLQGKSVTQSLSFAALVLRSMHTTRL